MLYSYVLFRVHVAELSEDTVTQEALESNWDNEEADPRMDATMLRGRKEKNDQRCPLLPSLSHCTNRV